MSNDTVTELREKVKRLELREQELIVSARTAEALRSEANRVAVELEDRVDILGEENSRLSVTLLGRIEVLLKERDEALVKLERANALLERWERSFSEYTPAEETRAHLSGTSDTNPRI